MQKILACLTAFTLLATPMTSIVSCGSTRTVPSIEDATNNIQSISKNSYYHDITYWSSDVISADGYKNIFMTNFINNLTPKNETNLKKEYQTNSSNFDYTNLFIYDEQNTNNLIPYELISSYEKTSNTGQDIKKYSDYKTISDSFNFTIYNNSDDSKEHIVYDSNEVNPVGTGKIVPVYNEKTKAFIFNFYVGVTIKNPSLDNPFVGARMNLTSTTKVDNYFGISAASSLINLQDKNFLRGKIKKSDGYYMTKSYDYRYHIQFYFILSS